MNAEPPASKISGQTLIFIIVLALLFLFFIWSSMTTKPSSGYQEIPAAGEKSKPAAR